MTVKGDMPYPIKLEGNFSTQGVVTRIDNVLNKISEYIALEKESLENTIIQMNTAKVEVAKPFAQEDELKEKAARVAQLNLELSLDAQKVQQTEIPKAIDGKWQSPVEKFASFTNDYSGEVIQETQTAQEVKEIQEVQANDETVVENFEVADNGGQGAFVSGDVHIQKNSENIPAVPETLRQTQQAAPNNIVIGGIKPLDPTGEKTNTPKQTQQTPAPSKKPDKPKRNYLDR